MAKPLVSIKHLQINKTNTSMFAVVVVCSIITVFSLMASRALIQQRTYQNRVVAKKKAALNQLKANNSAATALVSSYTAFVKTPENVIGGSISGSGDRDGDNAQIVLDALPSKYDFPALASSLEKILSGGNYKVNSITGTDDELNQQSTTGPPQPVEMPFELNVTGNYPSVQDLVGILERSIRPFSISKLDFKGTDNQLITSINAKTYYQPSLNLDIKKELVP